VTLEYLILLLSLLHAAVRDREALVAENLLLRHQLAVLTRPTRKRPRPRVRDKLFWVVVRALRSDWRRHLVLLGPESVIRWHRQAWRLLWRWRSHEPIGRPRLSAEVRELIATMARDNPRWGSERIRGELLKLGLVVSKRSIQRYRRRGPAHPSSQTWRTFLTNHAHHLGSRLAHDTDTHFQDPVRAGVHRPWSAEIGARERHREPDRGVGLAATDRGDALGLQATPSAP
jgi:hypothetical protein